MEAAETAQYAERERHNLSRLNKATVVLSVELGSRQMALRDLLQLQEHDVIELGQRANEALLMRANGEPIALGQVVVVADTMTLHLTKLLPAGGGAA